MKKGITTPGISMKTKAEIIEMHGIKKNMIMGFAVYINKPLLKICYIDRTWGFFNMVTGKPLTEREVDDDVWQGEDTEPMHGGARKGGKSEAMKQLKKMRKKPKRKGKGNYES